MKKFLSITVITLTFVLLSANMVNAGIPTVVKDRFVLGDPVWKEMAIREDLAPDYEMCWKRFVDIMVDKGYEIGFMEKESGYLRTNANSGLVRLKSNWIYEVKVIGKLVVNEQDLKNGKKDGRQAADSGSGSPLQDGQGRCASRIVHGL